MKTITILSGKGGVGKSSISASLAIAISRQKKIIVADCDVDASNLALVFGIKENDYKEWEEITTNQRPVFDLSKCDSCRKCFENCYFESIKWQDEKPELLEYSCEGCGMCELICLQKAIKLRDVMNARIGYAETKYGFKIDSAAGISCPVIASVTGSDYCLLITEPTPSSLSDMKKALELVKHFNVPHGIVINKYDINKERSGEIESFAKKNNIKLVGKLPYDKVFTEALVSMVPVIEKSGKLDVLFSRIAEQLLK